MTTRHSPEEAAADIEAALQLTRVILIVYGVVIMLFGAFAATSAFFAFKARNTDIKAYFILNIVFGALCGVEVCIVGAIFALIRGDTIVDEPRQTPVEVIEPND